MRNRHLFYDGELRNALQGHARTMDKEIAAARALFLGTPAGNDVWGRVVWCLAITAVFGVLSVWRYRRAVTR